MRSLKSSSSKLPPSRSAADSSNIMSRILVPFCIPPVAAGAPHAGVLVWAELGLSWRSRISLEDRNTRIRGFCEHIEYALTYPRVVPRPETPADDGDTSGFMSSRGPIPGGGRLPQPTGGVGDIPPPATLAHAEDVPPWEEGTEALPGT